MRAKRRAGGYHYIIAQTVDPIKPTLKQPPQNGPIHVE